MLSSRLKDVWSKLRLDFSEVYLSLAVLWFSIRVIPKPSRAAYPCQRATVGLISVKLAIVFSSLLVSTTSLFNRKSVKTLSVLALVGVVIWDPLVVVYYQYNFAINRNQLLTLSSVTYGFPSNQIIRVHSNSASNWDFNSAASKYWQNINQTAVDLMVERGVVELTGASDLPTAWNTIMEGYTAGQKVGIKINGNDWWYGKQDGQDIDSIPQLTNAIIRGLKSIGIPEGDIHIIENTDPYGGLGLRVIPPYYTNIVTSLYPDVVFVYSTQTNPTFGSVAGTTVTTPFGPCRINDQIASMDHLILVPIMKAITPRWGVTGAIKLMQGVIENVFDLHGTAGTGVDDPSANNPDVLIYQNPHIIGKTRLIVGDGLFGTWTGVHFGETASYAPWQDSGVVTNDVPKRWSTFNNGAPNLLLFGVDPVAMDSVILDHINRERAEQDKGATVSTPQLPEPQLIAGNGTIGVHDHGPPYTKFDYVEVELGGATSPTHDITMVSVQASPVAVLPGETVTVTVNVRNGGTQSESFTLSAYANTTLIGSKDMFLAAGATAQESFSWDTTGALGIYTIRAEASVVLGEVNTANNSRNFIGAVAVFTHLVEFPVASFSYSPSDPNVDDVVTFNAASSADPDGNIVSYVWDFGDGATGEGASATHAYSATGDYTVALKVTDNDGLFDLETKDLSVGEKQIQPLLSAELLLLVVGIAVAVIGLTIVLFKKRAG